MHPFGCIHLYGCSKFMDLDMTRNRRMAAAFVTFFAVEGAYGDSGHLEEIVIIGRAADNASSASQGIINSEQLSERPLLRTGEILEVVPGLVATQHSGSGKANQYFLRGFNLDHGTDFSTTVDKMPVNNPSHGHGQGYTDLNFIIPELVDSVTYKKGSYYADLGDFSGTGGAALYTKSAAQSPSVELGLGDNAYRRLLATGAISQGQTAQFIYGLEAQTYDGPWDDIEEDIDKKNLWLKQVWGTEANSFAVTAMFYDNSWNSADQIPSRAVANGLITELGSIDTTLGGESSRNSLSGTWQRKTSNSLLDASLYAVQYDLNLWSNFTYFTDAAGDQFEQLDDRTTVGWDISYALNGEYQSKEITNTFGSQLRHDAIDEVGLFASDARVRTGVYRLDKVDETSLGLFWENRIQWTDKLRSVLGVRYDNYHFDVEAIDAQVASTTQANSGSASDDIVTSSFNVMYDVNESLEAYFSIGQGFHSNDARGTTIELDPTTGEAVEAVDALVPTLGYEIGFRSQLAGVFDLSAALWHLDIDSELIFVGDAGTTEDTGVASERQGIELTLYTKLGNATTLDIEYSYTDAQFETVVDGSSDIPGALQTVFSAGINNRWSESFYTHMRVRYFGEYPLDGGATGDASTLVNLRAGYQINNNWSAKLDVLNLLDSNDTDISYFYASQLAAETQAVADIHYHVFEPRSYRLYVNYQF